MKTPPLTSLPTQSTLVVLLLFLMATWMGCSPSTLEDVDPATTGTSVVIDSTTTSAATPEGNQGRAANEEDLLANSTFSTTVTITFGSTVSISNPLAGSGVAITETNGDVVINATATGVAYELSGTSTNGSVKIYSDKKFKLTLNGLTLTNTDGPAINIQSGKRVFVVLADNTTNTLTDGASYTASGSEDMKGTFFSEGQLIFSGNGSLSVKANYRHGICSDDYVRVISGNITVTGAVKDAIHTNDAFIADGGTLTLTASDDGIQCEEGYMVINEGTFTINVAGKGIAATYDTDATIDPYVTVNGGTFTINSSGGEGIESKSILTINNGTFVIKTADDAINAGKFIYINGGSIYAHSTSNDGIDSNGPLTITGGRVVAVGANAPEAGIDCDRSTFKVTGGTLLGIGGSTSSPTASVSTQPAVILGGGSASQVLHIQASDGTEALTFLIPKNYSTLLFSSPKLKSNQTYRVYTGGSVANGRDFNGLYLSGTYTVGTVTATSFTTSSMVTTVGGSTGPGR
ncbi:hypothetical protein GCM10027275_52130 [Rhabdobacter roseus]|uniref:Carbohydrate-binding domain-containing protein n=1 Tax=Rhabdobacter roseus TaxID=1655419 RepID=A0A840U0J9_9BACT|nr:carbohydrate-binding domain-containing protein [Rhabdobacter roseus]MBB5287287.1 hypothetical protein [Rhabdobacter roseus]